MAATAATNKCTGAAQGLQRWVQGAVGGHRRRVRHRGAAVRAAAVRHHVGVPVTTSPTSRIENAVWQAARAIRTGQLQQSQGRLCRRDAPTTDKKAAFKKAMCAKAPTFLDCNSKAVVIVQSNANFGGIVEPSCATNGAMIDKPPPPSTPARPARWSWSRSATPGSSAASCRSSRLGNLNDGALADAGLRGLPHRALQLTPARRTRSPSPPIESSPCRTILQHSASPRRAARFAAGRTDAEGVAAVEFAHDRADHGGHVHRRGRAEPGHHRRPARHPGRQLHGRPRRAAPRQAKISQTEIADIMRVGGYHHVALHARPAARSSCATSPPRPPNATNTKQSWSCTYNGTGQHARAAPARTPSVTHARPTS